MDLLTELLTTDFRPLDRQAADLYLAAAVRGDGARLSNWHGGDLGDDPYAAAAASLDLVTEAFAGTALDAGLVLPEIRDGGPFPASLAISFHFVDLVVHAWDVAATI